MLITKDRARNPMLLKTNNIPIELRYLVDNRRVVEVPQIMRAATKHRVKPPALCKNTKRYERTRQVIENTNIPYLESSLTRQLIENEQVARFIPSSY